MYRGLCLGLSVLLWLQGWLVPCLLFARHFDGTRAGPVGQFFGRRRRALFGLGLCRHLRGKSLRFTDMRRYQTRVSNCKDNGSKSLSTRLVHKSHVRRFCRSLLSVHGATLDNQREWLPCVGPINYGVGIQRDGNATHSKESRLCSAPYFDSTGWTRMVSNGSCLLGCCCNTFCCYGSGRHGNGYETKANLRHYHH
jgi:hypothetical protein